MNIAILQARMGSSRLPGKVLENIHGEALLKKIITRIAASTIGKQIVVATSTRPEDDAVQVFCEQHKIACSRGSEWDVLDRFYETALYHGAKSGDTIIRICADNPLHSHKVVDTVLQRYFHLGLDYFSNSNEAPDFLEDGFDTEIFSFDALEYAAKNASLLSEREHVTPFIKNCGKFKVGWRKCDSRYNFKLSVDTPNDLQLAERIFQELSHIPDFSIEEVTDLLLKKPELLEINQESTINSGYYKSLREDRKVK
jgi:spore coat polysaccharide biosynthesis protein SpsF (cytidylyltransferase family)